MSRHSPADSQGYKLPVTPVIPTCIIMYASLNF
jgi:hypothetical protein